MLKGSRFARACYALSAVAVSMAVWQLVGASGAEPLFLKTAPAEPVAETFEPAVGMLQRSPSRRRRTCARSDQAFVRRGLGWTER